jgi:ParB-like chromosome segregation protein Spo0J
VPEIAISEIVIGKRHRKDMGDIAELAADISTIDMLEPIVVRPIAGGRYELACGERRLRATQLNGQTHIAAIVRPLTDAEMVRAEFSENTHRKSFTLSEAVAIKRRLEPLEKAAAKERQQAGLKQGKEASRAGELPKREKGRAADKASKATGRARRTLEKAEAIVDAAKPNPKRFGKLKKDMDRTGRVDGPFKRLKVMRQADAIRAEPSHRRSQAMALIVALSSIYRGPTSCATTTRRIVPYGLIPRCPSRRCAKFRSARSCTPTLCCGCGFRISSWCTAPINSRGPWPAARSAATRRCSSPRRSSGLVTAKTVHIRQPVSAGVAGLERTGGVRHRDQGQRPPSWRCRCRTLRPRQGWPS